MFRPIAMIYIYLYLYNCVNVRGNTTTKIIRPMEYFPDTKKTHTQSQITIYLLHIPLWVICHSLTYSIIHSELPEF